MDPNPRFSNFNSDRSKFKYHSGENPKPVASSFIKNAVNLAEKFAFKVLYQQSFSNFASQQLSKYRCLEVIDYIILNYRICSFFLYLCH